MDQKVLGKVLERCEKGEAIMDLCREYGLKRHTLYAFCKRNGILLKSKFVYRPYKHNRTTRKKIANEYKNGKTTPELAEKYGINHHTVIRYLDEFGVKIRTIKDNRKINGAPIINNLISYYKRSEAARKYGFRLTYEDVEKIVFRNCFYCGTEPCQNRRSYPERYNGIDRIDSSKGYFINNCVTACFRCNSAKNNMTLMEFKNWIHRLLDNDILKKLVHLDALFQTDRFAGTGA